MSWFSHAFKPPSWARPVTHFLNPLNAINDLKNPLNMLGMGGKSSPMGTPGSQYAPNNYSPLVNQMLTKGTGGTAFDIAPLMRNAEQQYGRNYRDATTNALTSADINAPNDPYARGFGRLKAQQAAGGAAMNQFGNLSNQLQGQNLNFLQGLLGQGYGAGNNAYLQSLAGQYQTQLGQLQNKGQMYGSLGQMAAYLPFLFM